MSVVFAVVNMKWSRQLRDLIVASIINCIWGIWFCRNQHRFHNKLISSDFIRNSILTATSMSGNYSKGIMSSSMIEFVIMKSFRVNGHLSKAPSIRQVDWFPPLSGWVKANSDGAARGSPGYASGAGLFRDSNGNFLGFFLNFFGVTYAFNAELLATISSIEIAYEKGWHSLWLECDSNLVIDAFYSYDIVPWHLKIRWKNCKYICQQMRFQATHILRGESMC